MLGEGVTAIGHAGGELIHKFLGAALDGRGALDGEPDLARRHWSAVLSGGF